ncbi:unnamed protein product [Heterobilharzia americana]|nr:unnamed protein product [Heterobilharzia americana]
MGGDNSKLGYRNAVIQLTTKTQPVDSNDNNFWDQFWAEYSMSIQDIFALIPAAEIRALRTEAPNNLATLCYKAVERIAHVAESASPTSKDQLTVLNCIRLLTRLLPYIFEDADWRSFFWSPLPADPSATEPKVCCQHYVTCCFAQILPSILSPNPVLKVQKICIPLTAVSIFGSLV